LSNFVPVEARAASEILRDIFAEVRSRNPRSRERRSVFATVIEPTNFDKPPIPSPGDLRLIDVGPDAEMRMESMPAGVPLARP